MFSSKRCHTSVTDTRTSIIAQPPTHPHTNTGEFFLSSKLWHVFLYGSSFLTSNFLHNPSSDIFEEFVSQAEFWYQYIPSDIIITKRYSSEREQEICRSTFLIGKWCWQICDLHKWRVRCKAPWFLTKLHGTLRTRQLMHDNPLVTVSAASKHQLISTIAAEWTPTSFKSNNNSKWRKMT